MQVYPYPRLVLWYRLCMDGVCRWGDKYGWGGASIIVHHTIIPTIIFFMIYLSNCNLTYRIVQYYSSKRYWNVSEIHTKCILDSVMIHDFVAVREVTRRWMLIILGYLIDHNVVWLQWSHNGCDSVSNHPPHDCLLNSLFRCRSKKTSKLLVTGLCVGNSPGTGEFPAQMASNAENVSIRWRHHRILAMIGPGIHAIAGAGRSETQCYALLKYVMNLLNEKQKLWVNS